MVEFSNAFEEMYYNGEVEDDFNQRNFTKQDLADTLATSRNLSIVQNMWNSWQNSLLYGDPYKPILQLLPKAAALYGKNNLTI